MFNRYSAITAFLWVVLAVSFFFDLTQHISWRFWWFDSYEHFLGGIIIGFFLVWVSPLVRMRLRLWHVVLFTLGVGASWELLEVLYPMGASPFLSWRVDTMKDLVLDTAGAVGAWYVIRRFNI